MEIVVLGDFNHQFTKSDKQRLQEHNLRIVKPKIPTHTAGRHPDIMITNIHNQTIQLRPNYFSDHHIIWTTLK